jgi:hypothetical protein
MNTLCQEVFFYGFASKVLSAALPFDVRRGFALPLSFSCDRARPLVRALPQRLWAKGPYEGQSPVFFSSATARQSLASHPAAEPERETQILFALQDGISHQTAEPLNGTFEAKTQSEKKRRVAKVKNFQSSSLSLCHKQRKKRRRTRASSEFGAIMRMFCSL